jgi:hypothetical protein
MAVVLIACALAASAQPADFGGLWNSATATPRERPASLKDKAYFTKAEAEQFERSTSARQSEEGPPRAGNVGTYNNSFWELSARVVKTLRTSIITDPPDGRLPPLTAAAESEKRLRMARLRAPQNVRDLGLQDRCLVFVTAIPPMLPYAYNSNYQIIQTEHEVIINVEMGGETRVIHLDHREHPPSSVRFWLGDSVGRWEGSTLVVDSSNFNDSGGFYGDAGGMFGWDRNLHVIERFSMFDRETILYQFEVDDPTAFTRPWKGEYTMSRAKGPLYEYACHEGNYALPTLLK